VKRTLGALVLALGLSLLGIYIIGGPAVLEARTYTLPQWNGALLLFCVFAFVSQWLFPALRLVVLAKEQGYPVPYRSALLIHLVTVLSAAVTPSGSGGGPAIVAGFASLGVPWGRSIGIAIQLFVLDLVFFSWAVPLSLVFLIASGIIALPLNIIVLAVASAGLAVAGSVVLGRYPRLAVRLMLSLARRPLLTRFRGRIQAAARDYYRSTRVFMGLPLAPWFNLQVLSALGWLINFALFWGLVNLYHAVSPLVIVAVLNITTLISFVIPTPGAAGFMEVAVGYGTSSQVSSAELAPALLLWRLASFYFIYAVGPLAGWLLFSRGWSAPQRGRQQGRAKPKGG
jgi:uncharacterized protein (TIRG00374 family)